MFGQISTLLVFLFCMSPNKVFKFSKFLTQQNHSPRITHSLQWYEARSVVLGIFGCKYCNHSDAVS